MAATRSRARLERRDHALNLRSPAQLREYDAIAARIAADRPGRILDWGAGWGQITSLLRDHGLEAVAFDYRPGVEGVETRPMERFPAIDVTISGEPWRLPFDDDSFGAVLSCGVLEHVEHPDASLGELRRVLMPGGTLYVYKLPNRFSYLELIARTLGMYHHGSYPHDRLYTVSSAQEIVSQNGFEVGSVRRANMLPLTSLDLLARFGGPIWAMNRFLSRIPGLNLLATNIELVATKPR